MTTRSQNYLPRSDADLAPWADNFIIAIQRWWNDQGLNMDDLNPLIESYNAWATAWPAHVTAQAAARAATQAKDDARDGLEARIRPLAAFVRSFPRTTDAQRAELGLSVPAPDRTPAPAPTSRPLVAVRGGTRLTHQLRLSDESAPTSRRKPRGVGGAEVWMAVVDAGAPVPTDPAALSFLTLTTRPTARAEFPASAGGKTAVYMLRWVSTRGVRGPWSEPTTATVAA